MPNALELPKKNPFLRPPFPKQGDSDFYTLHVAKSEALDSWENTERGFAYIFSKLVAPKGSGYAARRAYGYVVASTVRRQMIEAAAPVFFRNFPSTEAQESLRKLMDIYSTAGGRRNEFAHGIIGSHIVNDTAWHVLVPNTWTSRSRQVDLSVDYCYSSEQIYAIRDKFIWLSGQSFALHDLLEEAYDSAPQKAREPY